MKEKSVLQADDLENVMKTYSNLLFRLCLITLGNTFDAEDAVQETMIKYMQKAPVFENAEHQKAWLIKVASNKCRDIMRFRMRHQTVNIDEIYELTDTKESSGIIEVLMMLPEKYRLVLELYYVERFSTKEIASMIGKTDSAVKMRLQKGRKLLEEIYRKEYL